MNDSEPASFTDLMKDSDRFMAEVNKALQNSLRMHKMLGYPVAIWRDGQVVWVQPDQIPLSDAANGDSPTVSLY